ncbi:FACT complex subunit Ssrp1 [Diabrotica virgifera virgifera]|uniref:FACT complex subunit SSRP1 n=1 Tax=Diabrotica virgifera virgifera TaxID=50390 RepID=A0ABM5I921_DIAVI|nr:FACT complex subunit Ssrp1 [Diabrotica virgifera virgifera]
MELEYSDVSAEIKGSLTPGKLKLTEQNIIFKNSKSGKVQQIPSSDFDVVNFQNFAGTWGIRLFLKNGTLHRFVGFKDSEKDKIAKFFSNAYKIEMLEKELSTKGWNWGTAKFNGSVLSFDVGSNSSFEIPLNHVSQCTGGKNEITMEFHQNDDAPVSLMEMRFFIPANELAGDVDPVEAFQQQVMDKASVINISGDAIAIFREIHCLTPRGRYDIKVFNTFFQLHGKTFDYKIPITTVLRLFLLPHKDSRQMFFVVSLDPPIKQGQTRYHFLVFLFNQDEETSIELPFTEEELKEKFDGRLQKEHSGPTFEVMSNIMKNIINRKLTGPADFIGHSGTPAISCSFKAAAGLLYPLERGFIYVHKPPIHIRFEEIASVNFARGGGSTRSFDFEIELKSGTVHTFSSIEKEEYGKLFDFITKKKLNIKNRGKNDKASYKDDFGDSDEEAAPDAYLERVKAEGQERDDDDDDEDESTDEDFNPGQDESDVAEEYDSNHSSSSEDEDEEGGGGGDSDEKKKKKEKKKTKTISEKPRRKHEKKEKTDGKPKRATTAFMLWLNASREKIKEENKGISVTEIAKKGGEMWRELKDKSEWEEKAKKDKERYEQEMKEFKASGGDTSKESKKSPAKKDKKPAAKRASSPKPTEGKIKSKEYIDDSDSSSDDEKSKKKKEVSKPKKEKKDESSEDEKDKKDASSEDEKDKKDASSEDEKDKKDASSEDEVKDEPESEEERGKKRKKESDDEDSN